ncbi:hypothetical protein OIU77_007863 [Salix suchowensis]|uniref:Uncharacterized protein n=1 Tax=Salix suchowensis TaxID=1278906 RepID=A0ABQ9AHL8_9ROSI|nr:hypothetical protein OIU77_007863 [Salix suchowensis]
MIVVTWNVRGASKVKWASTIKDFKKIYAIDVFAVLEPRISGSKALNVATNLGFSHYHIVDAIGFSRGFVNPYGPILKAPVKSFESASVSHERF